MIKYYLSQLLQVVAVAVLAYAVIYAVMWGVGMLAAHAAGMPNLVP